MRMATTTERIAETIPLLIVTKVALDVADSTTRRRRRKSSLRL